VTRYVLTADAEQDLDAIKAYLLGQGGTNLARHVFSRLQKAMDFLGRMPGLGYFREDRGECEVLAGVLVFDRL
jgi:toxin ParE1/3/4